MEYSSKKLENQGCQPYNKNRHNNIPTNEGNPTNKDTPIQVEKFKNIYNLAKIQIEEPQLELLNYGLNFCPVEKEIRTQERYQAIDKLTRKIKIHNYFLCNKTKPKEQQHRSDEEIQKLYKPPSKWTPKDEDMPPYILDFINELQEELYKLEATHKQKTKDNLTQTHRKALMKLKNNKNIIIKAADKGSGVVIMTTKQYKEEVLSQLTKKEHYKETKETVQEIQTKIRHYTEKWTMKKTLPEKTAKIINTPKVRAAKFYILPKIHKNLEKPPGRPIMSTNGHPTEMLSQYVDLNIRPHMHNIPSYIKDTNHLIEICGDLELTPEEHLYTLDVSALYTNIPHQEGITALQHFLTPIETPNRTEMITEAAKIVLQNNLFEFDNQLYLQTTGTAMGTRMAPSYANIFMHHFETTHLPQAPIKPKIWKRYIDDILTILEGTEQEIEQFLTWINKLHPTIKFTLEGGPQGIPFLDTYLKKRDGRIWIRPYTKNGHQTIFTS